MHPTHPADRLSSCGVQKPGGVLALASPVAGRHTTAQALLLSSRRERPSAVIKHPQLLHGPVPGTAELADHRRRQLTATIAAVVALVVGLAVGLYARPIRPQFSNCCGTTLGCVTCSTRQEVSDGSSRPIQKA